MLTERGQKGKGQGHKPRSQGRKRPNGKAAGLERPLIVIVAPWKLQGHMAENALINKLIKQQI